MSKKVLGMIMAGGKGTRLYPLTRDRAKPAVPFGGKYRIIDFVLSNFINSGIYAVYVMTQFKSQSLAEHLQDGWRLSGLLRDHFIIPVPAQMRTGESWYKGTSDAIYQNLHLIERFKPDIVAIFGADHIYRIDIRQMIDYHVTTNSEVTVSAVPYPVEKCEGMGIIEIDKKWQIIGFEEKPKVPKPIPSMPELALVSMGNYLFNTDVLMKVLEEDAVRETAHDFGKTILPDIYKKRKVFAYNFKTNVIPGIQSGEEAGYWRDIGTIEAYWEAHMDLKNIRPVFNLYNPKWPLRTVSYSNPPAKFVHAEEGRTGTAINSLISEGTIVSGAKVLGSIIGRNARIHSYSEIKDSIIMDNVDIGEGAKITRSIIDKNVMIPPGAVIGEGAATLENSFICRDSGIVVVPKKAR
ncbi:MAG: glucose-1-phosphate adenylyltransferase [Candidatus Schekmanbacteria bacterium]|nr:glucose-1-phosphate adenylyltransferase [Candidatus Schekmanbacteria bacterium]